jgi:hypothetical protein
MDQLNKAVCGGSLGLRWAKVGFGAILPMLLSANGGKALDQSQHKPAGMAIIENIAIPNPADYHVTKFREWKAYAGSNIDGGRWQNPSLPSFNLPSDWTSEVGFSADSSGNRSNEGGRFPVVVYFDQQRVYSHSAVADRGALKIGAPVDVGALDTRNVFGVNTSDVPQLTSGGPQGESADRKNGREQSNISVSFIESVDPPSSEPTSNGGSGASKNTLIALCGLIGTAVFILVLTKGNP